MDLSFCHVVVILFWWRKGLGTGQFKSNYGSNLSGLCSFSSLFGPGSRLGFKHTISKNKCPTATTMVEIYLGFTLLFLVHYIIKTIHLLFHFNRETIILFLFLPNIGKLLFVWIKLS